MKTEKITTYDISISADNVWSGDGRYDHTESETTVSGNISDCDAILGGSQDKADEIYDSIVDAITDMDSPANGKIDVDGVTYAWSITAR